MHITTELPAEVVFMLFPGCEAATNILTNDTTPLAKIPEYKVSDVNAVLAVLDRAVQYNAFLARLTENFTEAPKEYTPPTAEEATLMKGDIRKIETWLSKLHECPKIWLTPGLS